MRGGGDWARFRAVINLATFGLYLFLLLGPYRQSPWTPFWWVVVPVVLIQFAWLQLAARRRRRDGAENLSVVLEDVVAFIEGAQKTLALRGDVLNRPCAGRSSGRGNAASRSSCS